MIMLFSITDTKSDVPVVTLSAKEINEDFLANDLKDQCIGMNIKPKVRIK